MPQIILAVVGVSVFSDTLEYKLGDSSITCLLPRLHDIASPSVFNQCSEPICDL